MSRIFSDELRGKPKDTKGPLFGNVYGMHNLIMTDEGRCRYGDGDLINVIYRRHARFFFPC